MNVLFLHGLDSRPGGVKPMTLAAAGITVANPALPRDDFAASMAIARQCLEESTPDVIVGSSRGGAVALALKADLRLVLVAPAWKFYAVDPIAPANTIILHSAHDAIIPLADSVELAEQAGLPEDAIQVVGADHGMNDPDALKSLIAAVRREIRRAADVRRPLGTR